MFRTTTIALLLASTAQIASADAPKIVTDIAPIHGLVSMVTEGVTEPALLIEPTASPHTNAMRPSAAAALQEADIVFWVGEELSPWLENPIETLSEDAVHSALLSVDGITTLAFRDTDAFGAEDHGHDDHAHDDHGHDHDHAEDHAHDEEHAHEEDHAHDDHDHDHAHDHSGTDPHAWLSPENAQVWLTHIADTLSTRDPANAETYAANAAAARDAIAKEIAAAQNRLSAVTDMPFVVFHDAYHYFEDQFGLETVGALSLSDAVPPSPAQVARVQADIREKGVVCVFSEPQFSDRLVQTVIDGTDAKTAELDPLGADIPLGPEFYPALLRDMTDRFVTCLQ
ncbi:zinc ABC transporter substrate-binding protein [Marivita hallyeonensis]|uniref:High-affinity zinc uptake system protein ZnuA n=1 Tax=Marivita hallyeonensis TaxID=996342 RepID=A0A1M5TIS7_9RHOB|nr:zinc ABC transporter substrate-binding protein [Marivita hallyeonensis]SHH50672.1 zinc transport system substrate-binding protein [Marivita hallyeonensis]